MKYKSQKSYRQDCTLAHSLDFIGDRWTLLLIRELICGTRRYGDLLSNLRGIGTNLLSSRLQKLSSLGIIEKTKLSAPLTIEVYQLTTLGLGLEPALIELARWGRSLPRTGRSGLLWSPLWNNLAIKARVRRDATRLVPGTLSMAIDGYEHFVRVTRQTVMTGEGIPERFDYRIICTSQEFRALFVDLPPPVNESKAKLRKSQVPVLTEMKFTGDIKKFRQFQSNFES